MNARTRTLALAAAGILLVAGAATVPALSVTAGTPDTAAAAAQPAGATLTANLRFTREEERLARDLYAALAQVHDGAAPMSNITRSEQRHFEAIGSLLDRYDVDDPSAGLEAGTYAFPELQDLYDEWYAEGSASLGAAYRVGVELEERDIADLEQMIEETRQTDVKTVLSHLLEGSRHHLAAFEAAESGQTFGQGGMQQGWGPGAGRARGHGPRGGGQCQAAYGQGGPGQQACGQRGQQGAACR